MTRPPSALPRRLLLALPALIAGCASPEPNYYTLAPRPPASPPPLSAQPRPRLVEMRRIGLAGYLDRPEIVRNNADFRLRLGTNQRWGEPLADLVARILAEDINLRLPGTSVFTSAGSITARPDATLEIDLQRLDADASGQVVLLAQVAVKFPGRDRSETQAARIVVQPAGTTTTDLVAAMSAALAQLADRIVPLLHT